MHAFYRLDVGVAGVLAELLEYSDLQALTATSRNARSSSLRELQDRRLVSLILPLDLAVSRRLLYGLHNCGLQRLKTYASIQIAIPEHVELLLERPVRDNVHSVKVVRMQSSRTLIAAMVEKLKAIDDLRTLDLADMGVSVSHLGRKETLCQRGHPAYCVPANLALSKLQVLVLGGTVPHTTYVVGAMQQLQHLHVRNTYYGVTTLTQLGRLRCIHTLELTECKLDRLRDLIGFADRLRVLRLIFVTTEEPSSASDISEFVNRLARLTTIHLDSHSIVDSGSASFLPHMPSLGTIEHPIQRDFGALAALDRLEVVNFHIDDSQPQDFSVVRLLKQLVQVTITPNHLDWFFEAFEEQNAAALIHELASLPRLKRVECLAAYSFPLVGLAELESVRLVCTSRNFHWLRSFTSLRKLELDIGSPDNGVLSLAHLRQLDELKLTVPHYSIRISRMIVAPLVNLQTLEIDEDFTDWSVFGALTKLRKLCIISSDGVRRERPNENGPRADSLRALVQLRYLDLSQTALRDVQPLLDLRELRTVAIPERVDCTPLVERELPRLVRLLHPVHNCLWSCSHRDQRQQQQPREQR